MLKDINTSIVNNLLTIFSNKKLIKGMDYIGNDIVTIVKFTSIMGCNIRNIYTDTQQSNAIIISK